MTLLAAAPVGPGTIDYLIAGPGVARRAGGVSPVVLGAALTRSDPAVFRMPVLVACAAGYGIALAWIGVRVAVGAAGKRAARAVSDR
jgi:hypothetical protein